MSSHTIYSTKSKSLHSAVLLALVGATSSAYAVNFGETSIQSAQSEPLSATIVVKDINSKDFKVSLANNTIYRQMGLTPNANIRVSFEPTSNTSGKIVLKSNTPINDPFADIVLDINNNNKKQFMPKTLLMPINENKRVDIQPKTVVAGSSVKNLPTTTVTPSASQPKSQPPKLQPTVTPPNANVADKSVAKVATPVKGSVVTSQNKQNPGIPDGEFAEATRQAFLIDQANQLRGQNKQATDKNAKADNDTKKNTVASVSTSKQDATKQDATKKDGSPKAGNTTAKNNKAQDNKNASKDTKAKTTPVVASSNTNNRKLPAVVSQEPPIGKLSSDRLLLQENKNLKNKQAKAKTKPTQNQQGKGTYVVQRNDNLWTIASELAERNNTNVYTVMKQIQRKNPSAFSHGNANLLIANKTLVLPDYEVIPSQSSLEKAIAARRASIAKNRKHKKPSTVAKAKKGKSSSKKSAKATANKHKSKGYHQAKSQQHKPKAHVSLVAPNSTKKPSSKGKASAMATSKNPLIKKLQTSRQNTAKTVTRVKQLNTKVNSYTKKLHLQNKKLAELEARLKKLKGQ